MTDADKCYLNIPFKEALKGVKVDAEGKVDVASLRLAADRDFENYKAIERRINDPDCGGGDCTCTSWIGYSSTFANDTSEIALAAGTFITVAVKDWQVVQSEGTSPTGLSGSSVGPGAGAEGWYQVSASMNLLDGGGTDPVQATLSILNNSFPMPSFGQAWSQSTYAPSGIFPSASVSTSLPLGLNGSFTVEVGLTAASSATRAFSIDGPGDNGNIMLSMVRWCGCEADALPNPE